MAFKRSDWLPQQYNSEAIVTAQTALSSDYCFQNKMAAENSLANKSSKKKMKRLKAHTIPLKAPYIGMVLTYFRKTKAPFRSLKQLLISINFAYQMSSRAF
jgi:hypothetical protein